MSTQPLMSRRRRRKSKVSVFWDQGGTGINEGGIDIRYVKRCKNTNFSGFSSWKECSKESLGHLLDEASDYVKKVQKF